MDSGTEVYLLKMKEEIIDKVTENVKESINGLHAQLTEVFGIRLKNMEEAITTLRGQSAEHYEEAKMEKESNLIAHSEILKEVDRKFAELRTEISGLDRRQSTDEGREVGKALATNHQINKKAVFWAAAAVIVGIIIFLAGAALDGGNEREMIVPKDSIVNSVE